MWCRLDFRGGANRFPRTWRLEFGREQGREIGRLVDELNWDGERKLGRVRRREREG